MDSLADLQEPRGLAEAVTNPDHHRHLALEEVAAVRNDNRHPGAHSLVANQRAVPDAAAPSTSLRAWFLPGGSTPGSSPRSRTRGSVGWPPYAVKPLTSRSQ
jgi:hypothetical protein